MRRGSSASSIGPSSLDGLVRSTQSKHISDRFLHVYQDFPLYKTAAEPRNAIMVCSESLALAMSYRVKHSPCCSQEKTHFFDPHNEPGF